MLPTTIMSVPCSSARSSQNALPPEDGWRRDRPKRRNVSMQEVGVNRANNALNDFTLTFDGQAQVETRLMRN